MSACGGSGTGTTAQAAPAYAGPPGAAVYQQSCARCHGMNMEGDGQAPRLDSVRIASLGDTALQMNIIYGKGQMPGFGGLSTEQINDLIAYLRTLP